MIKNLLFDLGGVIFDIRRERCVKAFEQLGLAEADSLLDNSCQRGVFLEIESGTIEPDEFRNRIRAMIPHDVTDQEIDNAFCQFLIEIPRHRLEALRQLRNRYRIYMLSNTNAIMWNSKIAENFRQEGLTVNDYFDGIITSFEVKAVKPDRKIFECVINRLGIDPAETLFLDDAQGNLDSAATLGFHTALVAHGSEFIDLIP